VDRQAGEVERNRAKMCKTTLFGRPAMAMGGRCVRVYGDLKVVLCGFSWRAWPPTLFSVRTGHTMCVCSPNHRRGPTKKEPACVCGDGCCKRRGYGVERTHTHTLCVCARPCSPRCIAGPAPPTALDAQKTLPSPYVHSQGHLDSVYLKIDCCTQGCSPLLATPHSHTRTKKHAVGVRRPGNIPFYLSTISKRGCAKQ
jgi:hypothetical protein